MFSINSCGCYDDEGYAWSSLEGDPSPCFVNGILANVLSIYFLLHGSITIFKKRSVSGLINVVGRQTNFHFKLLLIGLQFVFQMVTFITSADISYSYYLSDSVWWSIVSTLFSITIAFLLSYVEHYKSDVALTPLLLFWFFSILIGGLRITNLMLRESSTALSIILAISMTINSFFIFLVELVCSSTGLNSQENQNAYDYSNIFSKLSFAWITPLMQKGYKKFLTQNDLSPLPSSLRTKFLASTLDKNWNDELHNSPSPSLFKALAKSFGGPFLFAGLFKFVQDCITFIQPQLLKTLILFSNDYKRNPSIPLTKGFMIVFCMFSLSVLQTASLHQYFKGAFDSSIKVNSSLTSLIYEKSLRLSIEAKRNKTNGDIVNLLSVDTQRLQDVCEKLQVIWSAPFQILICLISLYQLLGNSMWIGIFILFITIPLNTTIFRYQKKLQNSQMGIKDQRIGLVSEIINNIKSLKLYAWANVYKERLMYIRNEEELKNLKRIGIFQAANQFISNSTPYVVSCSTFALFIISYKGTALSTEIIFPALALFNLLASPLTILPTAVGNIINAQVSIERITSFLRSDELQDNAVIVLPSVTDIRKAVVIIHDAVLLWSKKSLRPALIDINFRANKGDLRCIIGKVGSGKSALLQALLGNLYRVKGDVSISGSVAYVPQVSWIMNGTIQENIVFGYTFDPDFYETTLQACALLPDLECLPYGDETQVGEKGISLSGGQKARISLARALYSRADIYLLDDILSAVDEHVGKYLIGNVLGPNGLLKSKTRILVTNNMSILEYSNHVTLMSGGKIIKDGEYKNPGNHAIFSDMIRDFDNKKVVKLKEVSYFNAENFESTDSDVLEVEPQNAKFEEFVKSAQVQNKTDREEKLQRGDVGWNIYIAYANSCGIKNISAFILFVLLSLSVSVLSSFWLKYWSDINSKAGYNPHPWKYLGIYFLLSFAAAIFIMCQSLVQWLLCSISSSKNLHQGMLVSVMRAPMQFFESTPIGRILNRFSNDIYKTDEILPRVFGLFFTNTFKIILTISVIIYSTWQFSFIVFPLLLIYSYYQKYYLATSRELRRLDSVSKSLIISHLHESLLGVSTIRAYNQIERFLFLNQYNIDRNMSAYHSFVSANRWLAVRLEFIGSLVILCSSGLLIFSLDSGSVTPGLVGLSVSYALQVTQSLNSIVRMTVEIESNIVSVERILEYSTLKPEAPDIVEGNRPSDNWPSKGVIEFNNYSAKYRPDLDMVLKDIKLSIKSREKIGIVGRTGAGKSSLALAIFRLIEPINGDIKIDDIDTSEIGLYDLRSKLSIIPQDSQIFQGTIRFNLDPINRYSDEELWDSLKLSHLEEHVLSIYNGLPDKSSVDYNPLLCLLDEGGSNLSAGQKQLMCLARALTKKGCRVLILDEATANVDVHTDAIVQETLRSAFRDRTILTIAHRLNTILDSDRIIVLENGKVMEFETPENLLKNENSLFYLLCKRGGLLRVPDLPHTSF